MLRIRNTANCDCNHSVPLALDFQLVPTWGRF